MQGVRFEMHLMSYDLGSVFSSREISLFETNPLNDVLVI